MLGKFYDLKDTYTSRDMRMTFNSEVGWSCGTKFGTWLQFMRMEPKQFICVSRGGLI